MAAISERGAYGSSDPYRSLSEGTKAAVRFMAGLGPQIAVS